MEGAQQGSKPERQQTTGGSAQESKHHALREELANQAPTTCADRQPNRYFLPPQHGARQQQVGDIGAGDQQYQASDHGHQSQKDRNNHQKISSANLAQQIN